MGAAAGDGLTDQQRRAVTARDVSVALSAGAGCGKTFVLTERFLAELEPGPGQTPPRSKLAETAAITFTERAAREMRERIRAACNQRLLDAPEEHVDYWLHLVRQLDSARISTIHSFCASLLRAHAVEARLEPRFRVMERAQADTLLFELLDEQLRGRLADRDEAVIDLTVEFGLEGLRGRITRLLSRRQEIDWHEWLRETPESLTARWANYHRNVTLPRVLGRVTQSSSASAVLDILRDNRPDHPKMLQRRQLLLERLPNLPESTDPHGDLAAIRDSARVQGGGPKTVWPSDEIYFRFRDAAQQLRELIKSFDSLLQFDPDAALPAAETGLKLLAVAADTDKVYQAKKQELAVLDFDDLLIHTRQLLCGADREALRQRISSQFRLLLVDEFQDTDPVQVELVKALSGEKLFGGKLFFVGDYKQSIYRFRGADPRVFRQLRDSMPESGRMPLSLNFRSQPAILDFVNGLFCDKLGPDYEPLRAHRKQVGPIPAVEFLWASPAAENDPSDEDPAPRARVAGEADRLRRIEADWIARRIKEMLESGQEIVWEEQSGTDGSPAARPVRPGDVALLFRALSNVAVYEDALRRHGIDYYLVGGHAFYAQQEIFDLLNLLRAVANPNDEVSLAGVLRSPFFGLEDETLFWLVEHPDGLAGGLFADTLPSELSRQQRRRVEFAAATLAELHAMKDRLPVARLIELALDRTGYDAVLLAEFLGQRKLANLRKLIDQARSFDRSGVFSLADFITELCQFVARQPDEPLAATCPESADVVRLMTIHQAKGLEFPVVVVPDLVRKKQASRDSVAFTPELGPMVKTTGVGGFDLYKLEQDEEEEAETARLLYVATTRAADYLILSAGIDRLENAKGPWMELLGSRLDPATGKLRPKKGPGLICRNGPEAASHKLNLVPFSAVKVTTDRPSPSTEDPAGAPRRDLAKLADKAAELAQHGSGRIPLYLAPVPADKKAPRQYSFSRLSGEMHSVEAAPLTDEVEADGMHAAVTIDPLSLGSLVHDVLEEVEFGREVDVPAIVGRHAPRYLSDPNTPLDEPIEMITRFLASPRAAQIAKARQVHPELEFLLAWPPDGDVSSCEAASGNGDGAGRYFQGYIDCLYEDADGRWHLIDYKTNRVDRSTLEPTAAHYEMQMLVYALAVERILGSPPEELALCFLRPALEYHFSWDAAAPARAVELVNRALAAL